MYGFYIIGWILNSIKGWLVTLIIFVPLLHLYILPVDSKPLPSRYRDIQRRQGRNLQILEVVDDHKETASPRHNREWYTYKFTETMITNPRHAQVQSRKNSSKKKGKGHKFSSAAKKRIATDTRWKKISFL